MNTSETKHKWYWICSPCLIVSVLLFIAIIYTLLTLKQGDDWSLFVVVVYSITLLVLQTIDGILKIWLKLKAPALWFIETVVILGALPFFQIIAG